MRRVLQAFLLDGGAYDDDDDDGALWYIDDALVIG